MSRIAVFGATGLTGGLVVRRALAQGHEVVALVRDPARMWLEHPALVVIGGSPTAISDVERCVQGGGGSGTCVANRLVISLLQRWLLPIIEDKNRMEAALRASPVEWVSVRLPNIVDGPDKPWRVSADGRGIGLSISAESAARFLLEQVSSAEHLRSAPSIGH